MWHISIISILVLLPALTETPCWERKWGYNWVHPSLEASHTSPHSPKTRLDSLYLFFNLANFWALSSSLFLQSLLIFSLYFSSVYLLYRGKSPVSFLIPANHHPAWSRHLIRQKFDHKFHIYDFMFNHSINSHICFPIMYVCTPQNHGNSFIMLS